MMHWPDEGSVGGTDAHDRQIEKLFEKLTKMNDSRIRDSAFFKNPTELDDYDKEVP